MEISIEKYEYWFDTMYLDKCFRKVFWQTEVTVNESIVVSGRHNNSTDSFIEMYNSNRTKITADDYMD